MTPTLDTHTAAPMLTVQQITDAQLEDWRKLAQGFHTRFRTDSLATGIRLAAAIGEALDPAGQHLEVRITHSFVDLTLLTPDAVYRPADGGPERRLAWVTERDVELARQISRIAQEQGIPAEPHAVTTIELALDTADVAAVGPFWAALLTGDAGSRQGDDVRDPTGRVPLFWFQETDAHDTPRQRFHLDIWLAHDVAEQRIQAAVAAGGRVVDDENAPSFVVLADAEGNRACVCTFLQR